MSFSYALEWLKDGEMVYREGWNGQGMYVKMQIPDEHSKMRFPYLYMSVADGLLVPWTPSQHDLLSADWKIRYFE